MEYINYLCTTQGSLVESYYEEGDYILEMKVDVVVEPVLCLHKHKEEAIEVNKD